MAAGVYFVRVRWDTGENAATRLVVSKPTQRMLARVYAGMIGSTPFKAGNYPRWYDRQAFKAWNFVQYCRKLARRSSWCAVTSLPTA